MGSSGYEEWLPLLMAGNNNQDMLPLLMMMMMDRGRSNECTTTTTTDDTSSDDSIPTTFDAYLTSLVGCEVQVSVADAVDNGTILNGRLTDVATDFIIVKNMWASGVEVGCRSFVAIPISNIVGINRLPQRDFFLPFLEMYRNGQR